MDWLLKLICSYFELKRVDEGLIFRFEWKPLLLIVLCPSSDLLSGGFVELADDRTVAHKVPSKLRTLKIIACKIFHVNFLSKKKVKRAMAPMILYHELLKAE